MLLAENWPKVTREEITNNSANMVDLNDEIQIKHMPALFKTKVWTHFGFCSVAESKLFSLYKLYHKNTIQRQHNKHAQPHIYLFF